MSETTTTSASSVQQELQTDYVDVLSRYGQPRGTTRRAFLFLAVIFALSVTGLLSVYCSFPELQEDEVAFLKLPRDIDDAKNLGRVLARYKDQYFFTVLSAFFMTYIFLQSFAIPGSIFLSILSGFLFPFALALFLVCLCSAVGASLCYLLSCHFGRKIVLKYFPERAAKWAKRVDEHRSDLLGYMIFLRITPLLPNWFINITSPVVGIPALPFILGTFIGVAPPSFIMIQAGKTLLSLSSTSDAVPWTSLLYLTLLAFLVLIPALWRRILKEKYE